MNSLVTTFIVAAFASVGLTVAVRWIARRLGVVDYPDGRRKLHKFPIALWGGVAVYLALLLGLLVARWGTFGIGPELTDLSAALAIAAGIVCVCGAIDDCWCLNPRLKLALQIVAVVPIVAFGYTIDSIVAFGVPINLGWFGVPLTIAWLVGCINAINLLDGMDGLASTVGLLTAAMLAIIATSLGHPHVTVIGVALVGALAGFLVHNLPPASIFLGDSGSMVIGLALGVLGMQGALKTSATLAITIPAIVMSLPMLDTVLAVVRRKLTGRRFDVADREHIHHRLLDRGFSPWQTLCLLAAFCLATGAIANVATIFRCDSVAWIVVLTLMVLMIRLRMFGHHELALVKQAISYRLSLLTARLAQTRYPVGESLLLSHMPFDKSWGLLVDAAQASQACRLALIVSREGEDVCRQGWRNGLTPPTQPCQWTIAATSYAHEGEYCEISASGAQTMRPAEAARLTSMLRTFAAHFASLDDQRPEHTAHQTLPHDAENKQRRKAA
jgi:UDP-GlcNAc:undecaprenyl-phosphate/decaprenyl-phosphate GlcNAc-1-phosphate transferase